MKGNRYIRQIALPQVGIQGQEELQQACVLVVGAGGLGNALLPYLASSGIGKIGIVDGDAVALSNLHRQVLFNESDIGKYKAEVATQYLKERFEDTSIKSYPYYLTAKNAEDTLSKYDLVVDATDEIDTRYLLDDYCFKLEKPWVHASVYRFQLQLAVFNVNGSGTYRCLYPIKTDETQSCSDAGVMPSTVALAGMYQANEVLKYFLNLGDLLVNKVLLIDTLKLNHSYFNYNRQTESRDRLLESKVSGNESNRSISEINSNSLLLDVRDLEEQPNIDSENYLKIPLKELSGHIVQLKGKEIAVFCQTGKRSKIAVELLKKSGVVYAFGLKEQAEEIKLYLENGKV